MCDVRFKTMHSLFRLAYTFCKQTASRSEPHAPHSFGRLALMNARVTCGAVMTERCSTDGVSIAQRRWRGALTGMFVRVDSIGAEHPLPQWRYLVSLPIQGAMVANSPGPVMAEPLR